MGPPGSGKGTQAEEICGRRELAHISTGEMLREAMAAGTELGNKVKAVVENGDLVSDELILDLVRERLSQDDASAGYMLDGFPRTVPQAEGLLELFAEGPGLEMVLLLEVSDEAIIERLLARGRTDDSRETIQHRLGVYRAQTEPVVRYLREQGVTVAGVDGIGAVEEIRERIESVLDSAH
jgi:adenylate kinase